TPLILIEELLPFLDLVLVMTVNPGFGGQILIPECLEKVRNLAKIREKRGLGYLISADGGINGETAPWVREAGADILVTGSAFFQAEDKKALLRSFKGLI
ncbi:MAG: ribulose-phosphate 3-epimerase, partial [Treponema sp.]|nr:ribulose-phosphate 3-epimerase [Treponema sp.]